MKHLIIGTAGHIDHGKTRLTEALTGKNTDRLEEEQKRGITIENGYAMLTLPGGQTASIIDVPGHERFVRNMITGATGIDLALMVIAADDGFMPQTQEHLDILQLLGVSNGVIALTKCDLADDEWIETVEEDIKDRVSGTFLENAPMVRVSAETGQGIDELKSVLESSLSDAEPKNSRLAARLPVDRVFTVQGFGTVVTGTLTEGEIHPGDELMLYPDEIPVRVRGVQNHDVSVEEAQAGMRTAVNITGAEKEDIKRGSVLAEPGSATVTDRLDVVLNITDDCEFFIKNASRLHFFHGTSECICRLRLLDADELAPGDTGYAQLLLDEKIAARNGDRFIVRFFSPVITVGGGRILDARARRRKRNNEEVLARSAALDSDDINERAVQYIKDRNVCFTDAVQLADIMNISDDDAESCISELEGSGEILADRGESKEVRRYISAEALGSCKKAAEELLNAYHAENPLRAGMQHAEFRKQLTGVIGSAGGAELDQAELKAVIDMLASSGYIDIIGDTARISGFEPQLSEKQQALSHEMENFYKNAGCETRSYDAAAEAVSSGSAKKYSDKEIKQIYEYLCSAGRLIVISAGEAVQRSRYDEALAVMKEKATAAGGRISLGELRDALGFSRKYAQMYLEYWDRTGVTERRGDEHILI